MSRPTAQKKGKKIGSGGKKKERDRGTTGTFPLRGLSFRKESSVFKEKRSGPWQNGAKQSVRGGHGEKRPSAPGKKRRSSTQSPVSGETALEKQNIRLGERHWKKNLSVRIYPEKKGSSGGKQRGPGPKSHPEGEPGEVYLGCWTAESGVTISRKNGRQKGKIRSDVFPWCVRQDRNGATKKA